MNNFKMQVYKARMEYRETLGHREYQEIMDQKERREKEDSKELVA